MTARYQGPAFITPDRYIDIDVQRSGVWQIVSVQISPIKD